MLFINFIRIGYMSIYGRLCAVTSHSLTDEYVL